MPLRALQLMLNNKKIITEYNLTLNIPAIDKVRLEVHDKSKYSDNSIQKAIKAPKTTAQTE